MNYRVAKKILKNRETLDYNKGQIQKAETFMRRYEKNKKEA